MKTELWTAAGNEAGRMSKRALQAVCLYAAIQAGLEFLAWRESVRMGVVFWIELVALPALGLAVSYVAAMSMISHTPTIAGFLRFVLGFLGTNALLIIGVGGILLAPDGPMHDHVAFSALAIMGLGLITSAFLPAWPVAQALSTRPVLPQRLFKATRGARWSLFLFTFVIGSINKVVPSTDGVRSVVTALLYAAGSGLAGAVTTVAVVALSVATWRYSCDIDPALCRDASLPASKRDR